MTAIEASKSALRKNIAEKISQLTSDEKARQSKVVFDKVSRHTIQIVIVVDLIDQKMFWGLLQTSQNTVSEDEAKKLPSKETNVLSVSIF